MKILVVANSKGGSGKTTTVFNIAHDLAELGRKVLLVDFDPQASLTSAFKIDLPQNQVYIEDVISKEGYGKISIREAIVSPKDESDNLFLIPTSGALGNLDSELRGAVGLIRLREAIKGLAGLGIDVVVIDPPGSSDVFMAMSLMAAEEVIIPARPTDTDIKTLIEFIPFVEEHKLLNPKLSIRGILINQTQSSSKNLEFYLSQLEEAGLGGLVLNSKVRSAVDAANSIAYGKSVTEYKGKSAVAKDYMQLAKEISKWL